MRPRSPAFLGTAVAGFACGVAFATTTAIASPLDDPHLGGVGFSGPTTGDLAAVYWNPAAVGLIEGGQATISGTASIESVHVARQPIDAAGRPGGDRAFPETSGRGTHHPVAWPPAPGTFVGVGATMANRFTLAVAAYTPFSQRLSFSPAGPDIEPTRYHAVEVDFRNVAVVPALAFRIGSNVRVGLAPGFLFSVGRLVFDEDTALAGGSAGLAADCGGAPCGAENAAAAARYDLGSGLNPADSTLSFTLAGGIHYRRGSWDVGIAYATRPLGNAGVVSIKASRARVTRPARDGGGTLCPPDRTDSCTYAQIDYQLPDMLILGTTYRFTPRLDLTGIVRAINFSRHDGLRIRVSGPAPGGLAGAGLSENISLARGFQDAVDARVRLSYQLSAPLRVGASLRLETAAVPKPYVTAAAVDGLKFEPAVMAELRLGWFRLHGGYAFAFMPDVTTDASAFDPAAATACADAQGDLNLPACQARQSGTARPTAAGRYGFSRHAFTLSISARF